MMKEWWGPVGAVQAPWPGSTPSQPWHPGQTLVSRTKHFPRRPSIFTQAAADPESHATGRGVGRTCPCVARQQGKTRMLCGSGCQTGMPGAQVPELRSTWGTLPGSSVASRQCMLDLPCFVLIKVRAIVASSINKHIIAWKLDNIISQIGRRAALDRRLEMSAGGR